MPTPTDPRQTTTPQQTPEHHIAEAWETTRINANQLPLQDRIRAYAEIIRRAAAQIRTATEIAILIAVTAPSDAPAAWRHHRRHHAPPPPATHSHPPPPPPATTPDPEPAATTRRAQVTITAGRTVGTGTSIQTPEGDRRDLIATAAHVAGPKNTPTTVTAPDGTRHKGRVIATDPDADAALIEITPPRTQPPRVQLGGPSPKPGTAIYHHANGIHAPQNIERGTVRTTYRPDGMDTYNLNVSAGDSGGGIFNAETGALVGVISSTTHTNRHAIVFGANALRINQLTTHE